MPLAVVFGCAGPRLTEPERRFFADADPLGLILFARNCRDPAQVRALVDAFRAAVGRADAPVLIDQEGGRVTRLTPPHWRAAPAPMRFAGIDREDPARAEEAAWLNARLLAAELAPLGITVDCTPVVDVPEPGAHEVIGDRAAGDTPERAARLGRATCDGLLAGGVLPVVKHVPGHGRARADSHVELPVVGATREALEAVDFAPFRALADAPWAMTAHVVYAAIDAEAPATTSAAVVGDVVRGWIGFDGVLISDDICMAALSGRPGERAAAALAAGCDLALHCNGVLDEMEDVAGASRALTPAAEARLARAERRRGAASPFDAEAARARLAELMEGRAA